MLPGIHIAERPILYNRYAIGPGNWVSAQPNLSLGEIYAHGFIPLSRQHPDPQQFFAARSLRIRPSLWQMDKKRRYEHRRWLAYGLQRKVFSKSDFVHSMGKHSMDLAQKWMRARFGVAYLDPERLQFIFSRRQTNTVIAWFRASTLTAYAIVVDGEWGAHYWFVFYATDDASPSGHGYLADFLSWTQEKNLPFAYLGTGYGTHSLYKSRGFNGVTFWDGETWCADKERLAGLQKEDERRYPTHQ
jgi:hypothetical protein